jgi:hypothetical protein
LQTAYTSLTKDVKLHPDYQAVVPGLAQVIKTIDP